MGAWLLRVTWDSYPAPGPGSICPFLQGSLSALSELSHHDPKFLPHQEEFQASFLAHNFPKPHKMGPGGSCAQATHPL